MRAITTIRRLQLWRISESMNYQLHPDQIERTWSDHHIREWCEYQQILGKEAEERKKQMDL